MSGIRHRKKGDMGMGNERDRTCYNCMNFKTIPPSPEEVIAPGNVRGGCKHGLIFNADGSAERTYKNILRPGADKNQTLSEEAERCPWFDGWWLDDDSECDECGKEGVVAND